MLAAVAAVGTSGGFHIGLVVTAFGFGFRHGIDWDHIAALTDITSSQTESRRSMLLATLYAAGHALVVFCLGIAAIVLAAQLPHGVDTAMQRFVGATLILLGVYVFTSLIRHRRDFRMRSRWMLLFAAARRAMRLVRYRTSPTEIVEIVHDHDHPVSETHAETLVAAHHHERGAAFNSGAAASRVHRHEHRHVASMPDDPFLNYRRATAFGVGMLHGVGAETPTQVLIFVAAAGVSGRGMGVALLVCFLVGLVSSNTLIALAGTFGFLGASRRFRLYVGVSVVTALFSLVIGMLFLIGRGSVLPGIFGG
jgi:cytochrome c biogenesis protein CcdA